MDSFFKAPINIFIFLGIVGLLIFTGKQNGNAASPGSVSTGFPGWGAFMSNIMGGSSWSGTPWYLRYNTPDASAFNPAPMPDLTNNLLGYSAYDSYGNTQNANSRF
jgi:hypothetical protein